MNQPVRRDDEPIGTQADRSGQPGAPNAEETIGTPVNEQVPIPGTFRRGGGTGTLTSDLDVGERMIPPSNAPGGDRSPYGDGKSSTDGGAALPGGIAPDPDHDRKPKRVV